MSARFEYDRFIAISGSSLVDYMEPVLTDSAIEVPEDVLHRMLSELNDYDEYHTVYALELGADRAPKMFAAHVPRFLAHERLAVRCAADRILRRLPDSVYAVVVPAKP